MLGFETRTVNKIGIPLGVADLYVSKFTMACPGARVCWDCGGHLISSTWGSCGIQVVELGLEEGVGIHQQKEGDRVFPTLGMACSKS